MILFDNPQAPKPFESLKITYPCQDGLVKGVWLSYGGNFQTFKCCWKAYGHWWISFSMIFKGHSHSFNKSILVGRYKFWIFKCCSKVYGQIELHEIRLLLANFGHLLREFDDPFFSH